MHAASSHHTIILGPNIPNAEIPLVHPGACSVMGFAFSRFLCVIIGETLEYILVYVLTCYSAEGIQGSVTVYGTWPGSMDRR